jgi:pimeloyl-ACP methyl ester carboxylesterase
MPIATINGFKHYWEEAGSGDALVMLHGAAGSGRGFYQHLPELSKTFRVLVPDMRSMGQSEHVPTIPPSAWVDDVVGLLDHLGIAKAHIFGSSLGARVALRFAIDHPERTLTLFIENPISHNEQAGNDALNARMANPDAMDADAQKRYQEQHGADWKDVVRNYFVIRNDSALQDYYDLREGAKSVTVPTLITRGNAREQVHPLPHAIALFESIKTAQLWVKPAGGIFATPEGYDVMRNFVAAARQPAAAAAR